MVIDNTGAYQSTATLAGSGTTGGALQLSTYSRGIVDQFFFTIIYIIVVYLMANASFKLIDSIPNQILRFAGTQATGFSDNNENPGDKLISSVGRGGMVQGEKLVGAVESTSKGIGGIVGKAFKGTP